MRRALTALLLLALATPAFAAEPAKGKPGTNVEMPYLMAPMNDADGKLDGYAYIQPLLTATSDTNALAVRDKLAFIQDAFVRDVNGPSVASAADPASVDQPKLAARLLADAKRIMGANRVATLSIVSIQIAPLHPTETPALYPPTMDDSAAKPAPAAKPKS
jgi:hypothetical protein